MNWEQVEGKWSEFKGNIKEKWGKLTDNDIMQVKGKKEQLIGKLRERYGYAKEKAEEEVSSFLDSCGCDSSSKSSCDSKNNEARYNN